MTVKKNRLILILDGWGVSPTGYPLDKNAIATAKTPYWDSLLKKWPHTLIQTSGNAVGLPEGVMGNSEVGHLNLGAGRIVWQEITRIDKAIEDHGLADNKAFAGAIAKARDNGRNIHLMGLVSDGGVHSIDRHYFALLRLAKKMGMPSSRVMFHVFLDGRDTPPRSGKGYVEQLEKTMREEDLGRIAMVSGRYYAMDRDHRWDRVKKAYDAMVSNVSEHRAVSGVEAVEKAYLRNENDEFVLPTVVEANGKPIARIASGDQVIFFNFRPDRARQISHALVDDTFDGFKRDETLKIDLTSMTEYEGGLKATVAFPPQNVAKGIAEMTAAAGLRQLRIAETEKYAHVTYFFSGGREKEYDGEDRVLVPSPKVATYDLQPEMSLPEVAARLEEKIRAKEYHLIVCNFANGDMVGHTGIFDAAVKAAEAVDAALARVIPAILETGGSAIVTADHGNADQMWNFEANCPHTQHTTTPTPCVLIDAAHANAQLRVDGCLGDVAPTMMAVMGLPQPEEMTGRSLVVGQ